MLAISKLAGFKNSKNILVLNVFIELVIPRNW